MFRISSLPLGVTLRTLPRLRMILRVSVWYADPSFTLPGDFIPELPDDLDPVLLPPPPPPPPPLGGGPNGWA